MRQRHPLPCVVPRRTKRAALPSIMKGYRYMHRTYFSSRAQAMFPIILLLILFVSASVIAGYFYYTRDALMKLHTEKVETLNKKIISLSENIRKRELANRDLEHTVETYKTQIEHFQQKQIEQETIIKQLTDMRAALTEQLTKLQTSLTSGLSKLDDFSLTVDSKLNDYLSQNTKEITRVLSESEKKQPREKPAAAEGVELPTVVVTSGNEPSAAGTGGQENAALPRNETKPVDSVPKTKPRMVKETPEIKVMKVDQKHNFLIINKGMIDGMKVNTPIDVYRKDIKIGTALITEVRELLSLAMINEQYDGHFIEEGDLVRLR